MPWLIQEVVEDRRGGEGSGEMNCGNLGRGVWEKRFCNIHCLTSIKFLKQSVQQSDQIMTEKK